MFKRILVPLDGSQLSEQALPVAAALVRKFDSELILLHVLDASAYSIYVTHPEGRALLTQLNEQARQDAGRYLTDQGEALGQPLLTVRTILYDGAPAAGIIEVAKAEAVHLIVMSTHGRSGLARWAYGSVAERVARHGPCPVLLVRPEVAVPSQSGSPA